MLKVYQKYLIKDYLSIFLKISFIFVILGFVMGILEELNFFSGSNVKFYFPVFLVFLNIPSLIYEIFPFIFLLTSQFFFINLLEKGELNTLKNKGLNSSSILKILGVLSFILGILIIIFFYNLSAELKFQYLDIKKNYTKDNKYLATITENGLWIKDEKNGKINFINASKFSDDYLYNLDVIQLDKNFNFLFNIKSKKAYIKKFDWLLYDVKTIDSSNVSLEEKEIIFETNFNSNEINNLFSNLSSLTLWKLVDLKENYNSVNYSTTEIDYHLQKIISYPFFITIISVLTSILMLNIKHQKPKIFLVVLGILISVFIYYVNFFFGALGKNEKIPLYVSVWAPIIILIIVSSIGIVRINEK